MKPLRRLSLTLAACALLLLATVAAAKRGQGHAAPEPRSSRWPAVRAAYLKEHPACELCGRTVGVEIHHVKAFSAFPELELDPSNFLGLCRVGKYGNEHLIWGHGGDFKFYNPSVREDVKHFREMIQGRKPNRPEE